MKKRLAAWLGLVLLAVTIASAQGGDEGYQMARVLSFEHLAANAQHMENSEAYKISMRLGDMVYICHSSSPAEDFLDWSPNKQFPAKLNGPKMLLVKTTNGQIAELNIVSKKQAK